MTREICGARDIPSLGALCTLLLEREERSAQGAYIAQQLWRVSALLESLAGGAPDVPDYFALFGKAMEAASAQSVKEHVLSLLQ